MRQVGSALWPKLRLLQIYGANTGVGKTIFSSILCRAFQKRLPNVHYLKPVSTGPQDEADDRHLSTLSQNIRAKCLYQFAEPPVHDADILAAIHDELTSYATGEDGLAILETAGGVLSPAPSGSSQADLYRPLRLPVCLVGDAQLGGIGTTISAWESLHLRGYDVHSVALFAEGRYDNHTYLTQYFADRDIHTFSVPPPPKRKQNAEDDAQAMRLYYEQSVALPQTEAFTTHFLNAHEQRLQALQAMPAQADARIWHPFMQHRERSPDTIVAMDSAYGDLFQTYSTTSTTSSQREGSEQPLLRPAFDGSASWWTQGLGHGNPQLALTAAHAAGRYGHVMFANAVHAPALELAETLVTRLGNPRLKRVFYSDNGSTGMEVAVKMALRANSVRKGWKEGEGVGEVRILGLRGSYHGDTIGTMDCSEPSIYNQKVEWYRGRGVWVDFPQVKMRRGRWVVETPVEWREEKEEGGDGEAVKERRSFESLDDVFDFARRKEDEEVYMRFCRALLVDQERQGVRIGALILEPILLGAGGMMFADPLFQRVLVHAVRGHPTTSTATSTSTSSSSDPHDLAWQGIPVIFDEVFTGLYRLGRFSAASFLDVHPDIVVNAKLLTGGLLPLCTTTASEDIFAAFLSADKSDALLHGHSYTAHAVGCAVANQSLRTMTEMERGGAWSAFREGWVRQSPAAAAGGDKVVGAWSMWSRAFVEAVSHRPNVDYVFALGSVLAISLKDPAGASYASTAATGLRDQLFQGQPGEEWVIHSRVLGNVLYLMAAMTTGRETLAGVEERVFAALE